MGYTRAVNDIGASYNKKDIEMHKNHSVEDTGFGKIMKDTRQPANSEPAAHPEELNIFSAGAAIDMLSVMAQLKVNDESDLSDELDEAIGFDEIEELDSIADSEEIRYEADSADIFGSLSVFSESDDLSEVDLSVFDLIEEVS